MIRRLLVAALVLLSLSSRLRAQDLRSELDRILDDPLLSRALVSARVEALSAGRVIYERNSDRLVIPASNMKIFTVAAAAERLGWDYRFETRLEAAGPVRDGTLAGDLVVTGSGDPSIGSPDGGHALLFLEWATALERAGIRRISGRVIGDDNAFDDDGWGFGWSWDDLSAGYGAPAGALSYNENTVIVRVIPGRSPGSKTAVTIGPPGHGLMLVDETATGPAGSAVSLEVVRRPADMRLIVRGAVPAGGTTAVRAAAIDNPTRFFVDALELALARRGITVAGGAWDIDDLTEPPPATSRTIIAAHQSEPLSSLAGYAMKESQNFYVETLLKAVGRQAAGIGTAQSGRRAVQETLARWDVPADAVVQRDGSGLSRYNYVTTSAIVTVLRHVWDDERLRGRFVADLPVAAHDGTLALRMRNSVLDRHVQAKTGTLSNVRSLSGFLETASGEKLIFSIIVNHYTAPTADVDAVVERALERLYKDDRR